MVPGRKERAALDSVGLRRARLGIVALREKNKIQRLNVHHTHQSHQSQTLSLTAVDLPNQLLQTTLYYAKRLRNATNVDQKREAKQSSHF